MTFWSVLPLLHSSPVCSIQTDRQTDRQTDTHVVLSSQLRSLCTTSSAIGRIYALRAGDADGLVNRQPSVKHVSSSRYIQLNRQSIVSDEHQLQRRTFFGIDVTRWRTGAKSAVSDCMLHCLLWNLTLAHSSVSWNEANLPGACQSSSVRELYTMCEAHIFAHHWISILSSVYLIYRPTGNKNSSTFAVADRGVTIA